MKEASAVRAGLLEAAKREFLDRGYTGASLRKICADAAVTTGAMYFFFRNKEELFTCIVGKTAEHLLRLIRRQIEAEANGAEEPEACQRELIAFLCDNRDEVRILLDKSAGTPYEGFREALGSAIWQGFFVFYRKLGGTEEAPDILRLIVHMRMQGYAEMLKGDYDMDKMLELSALMEVYGSSGLAGMMGQLEAITGQARSKQSQGGTQNAVQ